MSGKIAVLGTGANGASIGADLTRAGLDVVLIDQWAEHVISMRQNGITIEMPDDLVKTRVRAYHLSDIATFTEQFDYVLLLMKTYDTRWACHLIEPHLKSDGLLAGVQNGITTNVISEVIGPERTMGCVIEISSMMFVPGIVQRHSPHDRSWFAVGGIVPSAQNRSEEIAELLRYSGSVETVDDIQAVKWMKLVSNATTLVSTALLGLPLQEAASIPEMRELMIRSGQEALDTGIKLGHQVKPIFGLSPEDIRNTNRLVEALLDTLVKGFVLPDTKTTVLQDWIKGRRSEAEDLNGLVVRESERLGFDSPVNSAIVEISRRIESRELDPSPNNLILLKKLLKQ